MTSNKTTPTGAGTPARAATMDATMSYDHFSTKGKRNQPVADVLLHGADHAITAKDIAALLGWNVRAVTKEIQRERLAGLPIAACQTGYFLPATADETDNYVGQLSHRKREVERTLAAVAATRQQRMIFGGGEK